MPRISKVFVDADACPVKEEIVQAGQAFNIPICFVASHAHQTAFGGGTWIYVDSAQDEVDFHIYKLVKQGELVVTQDMGLAALLVKKGIHVLTPRGESITDEHMDTILYNRYVSAKLRRQGTFSKGPKAFSAEDKKRFLQNLQKILSNNEGIR